MAQVRFVVDSIPPSQLQHLINVTGRGSLEQFLIHVIDFGEIMCEALLRSAKIACGNDYRGYYAIDIKLANKIPWITNMAERYRCEIPDLPTYGKLERIAKQLGVSSPDAALPRLIYWFSNASFVAYMYLSMCIMDHRREDWRPCRFPPLWDVQDKYEY